MGSLLLAVPLLVLMGGDMTTVTAVPLLRYSSTDPLVLLYSLIRE